MTVKNKKPLVSDRTQGANIKAVTKNDTIMNALAEVSLTRFDAEQLGDHCLPSTISGLSKQHGLELPRRWVKVPNRFGGETSVMRYWLSVDDSELVDSLLEPVI